MACLLTILVFLWIPVPLLAEGVSELIRDVAVTTTVSEKDTQTTINVTLNPEQIFAMDDLAEAFAEDADGEIYEFTSADFIRDMFSTRLFRVLPFQLPGTGIRIVLTDTDGNTHLFHTQIKTPKRLEAPNAVPFAGVSYDGTWEGSGDHYDVSFTVENNKLTLFEITFGVDCGTGYWYRHTCRDWNPRSVADGDFSFWTCNGSTHFEGTFANAHELSGTLEYNGNLGCVYNGTFAAINTIHPPPAEPDPGPGDPVDPNMKTVYIPHITGGYAEWTDYLQVDNFGIANAPLTLTLYAADGTSLYTGNHTVPRLGKKILTLKKFAGAATATSGVIRYTEPNLKFRLTQVILAGGIAEFELTDERSTALVFMYTDSLPLFNCQAKGLALTNFGANAINVTLSAIGGGATLATKTVTVQPNAHLVGVHAAWFPGVDINSVKSIRATAPSKSMAGISISGNAGNTKLLFTPGISMD